MKRNIKFRLIFHFATRKDEIRIRLQNEGGMLQSSERIMKPFSKKLSESEIGN